MVGSLFSYLNFGGAAAPPPKKQAIRALPGNWYTSEQMYQLERRAIFSRRWLLITHKSRLANSGDYLRYNIANYDVVISKDQAGEIHSFHNVCKYRAHPVVEQDYGNAKTFPCQYCGSSYNMDGSLAPSYQELTNYDNAEKALSPIHARLDKNDFIWINMDSKKEPEVSWESQFDHVDEQTRFDQFDFNDYEFDHTWNLEGPFNWKVLADNFNECYHCKTTHPDLTTGLIDLESYDVHCDPKGDHIQHDPKTPDDRKALGQEICSTYCFPNVSFTVTKHFLFIQKFMPKSPSESIMYYEVWRNKHSAQEDFLLISDTYKRVMAEDKVLCERAQKNINAGVFVNGELHPHMEKGPLFFQKRCREIILEHGMREKREGRQVWPAEQQPEASCSGRERSLGGFLRGSLLWSY